MDIWQAGRENPDMAHAGLFLVFGFLSMGDLSRRGCRLPDMRGQRSNRILPKSRRGGFGCLWREGGGFLLGGRGGRRTNIEIVVCGS